jgi:hypothetical protein
MNYSSVTNPQWGDAAQSVINCNVNFEGVGEVPFTANPNDLYEYSKQIFADCVSGKYGPIEDYVSPPPYVPTSEVNKATAEQRLQATDWVNEPDVYDPARNPHLMNRDAFLDYRSWCRNIAVYPVAGNLDWPAEPVAVWS